MIETPSQSLLTPKKCDNSTPATLDPTPQPATFSDLDARSFGGANRDDAGQKRKTIFILVGFSQCRLVARAPCLSIWIETHRTRTRTRIYLYLYLYLYLYTLALAATPAVPTFSPPKSCGALMHNPVPRPILAATSYIRVPVPEPEETNANTQVSP